MLLCLSLNLKKHMHMEGCYLTHMEHKKCDISPLLRLNTRGTYNDKANIQKSSSQFPPHSSRAYIWAYGPWQYHSQQMWFFTLSRSHKGQRELELWRKLSWVAKGNIEQCSKGESKWSGELKRVISVPLGNNLHLQTENFSILWSRTKTLD